MFIMFLTFSIWQKYTKYLVHENFRDNKIASEHHI